jgi:hypothetical protein
MKRLYEVIVCVLYLLSGGTKMEVGRWVKPDNPCARSAIPGFGCAQSDTGYAASDMEGEGIDNFSS